MSERYTPALPAFKADGDEWLFFRDTEKKDTLVMSSTRDYYLVNPLEMPGKRYRGMQQEAAWAFQFGAYAETRLIVWARSLEDGLEEAAGWLAEFAPGHLTDLKEEYEEALKEAREELGEDAEEDELQEKAQEIAETDMTYTESGYLTSHEWYVDELTGGSLLSAVEYASRALLAAQNNNYDMIPLLPLGKGEGERVELEEEDIVKMFADTGLGLSQQDIERIADAKEEEVLDLKGFKLERVG